MLSECIKHIQVINTLYDMNIGQMAIPLFQFLAIFTPFPIPDEHDWLMTLRIGLQRDMAVILRLYATDRDRIGVSFHLKILQYLRLSLL